MKTKSTWQENKVNTYTHQGKPEYYYQNSTNCFISVL